MPYLFNRTGRLAPGNLMDAMSWAVAITEKVNSVADTPVSLWSTTLSPRVGTLAWTTIVSDLAELSAIEEKLLADGGYLEMVEKGAGFLSPEGLDDAVVSIVHAHPYERETLQYAAITTATLAPGEAVSGVQLGVEIADRVHAVSGCATVFGTSLTGAYGEVGWIALCDSIEQVQHLNESLAADQAWLTMLDERASKVYSPGSGMRQISRKIA
ncbi:MAG TPA: hypothetical protein VMM60_01495 [Ilumatobacter sp.]|nr:hypothetical protein [Ilumatobacter sp.]